MSCHQPQAIPFPHARLQHDDGVDSEARSTTLDVTKGRASADGCQVSATFFVQKDTKGWTGERPLVQPCGCLCVPARRSCLTTSHSHGVRPARLLQRARMS